MRIAPEGYSNIFPILGLALAAFIVYSVWPGITILPVVIFTSAALCLTLFFRDPARTAPAGDNFILSPADGRVITIGESPLPGDERRRISIFLSIFNVHVNRTTVSGTVENVDYRPGKFFAAWRDRAAVSNEMNRITIVNHRGTVVMQQVTGVLARRVVCHLQPGQKVEAGERFGIMKFGSRMDVICPSNVRILVDQGDKVKAGVTIIGEWTDENKA